MSEWGQAWRQLVEGGGDPRVLRRLHQGLSYYRAGRVSDLRVTAGGASVRVQGDRATPFSPEVSVPPLDDEAWERVIETLAGQVRHTARLLAGHAPDGLDVDLEGTGVRVLPTRDDMSVTCGCDDATWPCSHVAALWEALASKIEEDPFALLRMRGRGRERLLSELAAVRRRRVDGEATVGVPIARLDTEHWTTARGPIEDLGVGEATVPRTPAGTLRILGDPPGWAGGVDAWKLFHPLVEAGAAWVADLDEADG
jgi:uncharacterized Zn finger protein